MIAVNYWEYYLFEDKNLGDIARAVKVYPDNLYYKRLLREKLQKKTHDMLLLYLIASLRLKSEEKYSQNHEYLSVNTLMNIFLKRSYKTVSKMFKSELIELLLNHIRFEIFGLRPIKKAKAKIIPRIYAHYTDSSYLPLIIAFKEKERGSKEALKRKLQTESLTMLHTYLYQSLRMKSVILFGRGQNMSPNVLYELFNVPFKYLSKNKDAVIKTLLKFITPNLFKIPTRKQYYPHMDYSKHDQFNASEYTKLLRGVGPNNTVTSKTPSLEKLYDYLYMSLRVTSDEMFGKYFTPNGLFKLFRIPLFYQDPNESKQVVLTYLMKYLRPEIFKNVRRFQTTASKPRRQSNKSPKIHS